MNTVDGAGESRNVRDWLRSLAVFAGPLAEFDPADAPTEPVELFLRWLEEAIAAGVPDPHAMTVSTVGADGSPDARVLILKNLDSAGWQFAASADSPKGRQLNARPEAALTFYWPTQGRQIRVRGTVSPESAERSAADLLARSPAGRAEVLLGRQSSHLESIQERDDAIHDALSQIESNPALVTPTWMLYTLVPTQTEFWQADKDRNHTRLRYERPDPDSPWQRHLLWP